MTYHFPAAGRAPVLHHAPHRASDLTSDRQAIRAHAGLPDNHWYCAPLRPVKRLRHAPREAACSPRPPRSRVRVLLLGLSLLIARAACAGEPLAVVTGATSGVYFHAGQALCDHYVRQSQLATATPGAAQNPYPTACKTLPTTGSVTNFSLLRKNVASVAIVQSDVQFQAFAGLGPFTGAHRFADLRTLFSLHPETVAILVHPATGITRIDDLTGKRFGFGSPGSGSRLAAEQLIAALGWPRGRFATLSSADPVEAGQRLCGGSLDAFLVVTGHPADTLRHPILRCSARLIPVNGAAIDRLLRDNRYLVRSSIPVHAYKTMTEPVPSYGPLAVVVTTTQTHSEIIYRIVRGVFENLGELRRNHAAFANLNPRDMISAGMTAPLHDGAVRYYRERGWIK